MEKHIMTEDENGCRCNGDTHYDEDNNERCSHCDMVLSTPAERYIERSRRLGREINFDIDWS